MHTAILGLSGAALVTSLVALRAGDHTQGTPATVFQPPAAAATAPDVRLTCTESMNWGQLLTNAGESARRPYFVDWTELRNVRLSGDNTLEPDVNITGVTFKDLPLPRALALINRSIGQGDDNGIDAREQEGVLVISTVAHLDRLEQTLSTFDLSGLVAARRASLDDPAYPADKVLEEAISVIQSLVHSDLWQNNGGDRAQISSFDSRLFVKAPRRIMPQLEWVIGEMNKGGSAAPVTEADVPSRAYPLARSQAVDVATVINDRHHRGVRRVVADPSTNSIIVTATPAGHDTVASVLRTLDPAAPRADAAVVPTAGPGSKLNGR